LGERRNPVPPFVAPLVRSYLGRGWNTDTVLLDAEYVYLALTRKETSLFESPGGLECARVERACSKVLAEDQRILVEATNLGAV
jgi:hypothetical protein